MSENESNASDRSGTKRKLEDHHLFSRESDDDDDTMSIGSSKYSRMSSDSGGSSSKKQNHSEIEKRRRDKMNCYISELSQLIPMCQSRKLDKLTVLRMTVQHMKMLRNSAPSAIEGQFKPAFVTDQDMKNLILQAADGFVFVVGCDRGRVLYVSKSVEKVLDYTQDDLIGQSLFDILHPRDVSKVKEQLASSDLTARSQLIDSKTLLPIPTSIASDANSLCPGSMRSFFCRMKCGQGGGGGGGGMDEADTMAGQRRQRRFSATGDKRFKIVHCAGYLKAWVPSSGDMEKDSDEEGCNLSCLVAIGRLYSKMAASPFDSGNSRPLEFFSRHTTDGKFLYADQRVTLALGYLPHELVGTSIYELCHPDDIVRIAETHRHCLQSSADETQVYKFRVKNNSFVTVRTKWKAFKNPWTKELEYISASNQIMNPSPSRPGGSRAPRDIVQEDLLRGFSPLKLDGGSSDTGGSVSGETTHKFDSISASKIGRRIADEVLDSSRRPSPSLTSASPASNVETLLENIRDNSNSGSTLFDTDDELLSSQHLLSEVMQDRDQISEDGGGTSPAGRPPPPPLPPPALHGRNGLPAAVEATRSPAAADAQEDEAAMAVIMSLLEADAGLGGPVDFTGLPWPLP